MDQITHDVRRATWQSIIKQCQERPGHTTVKRWCLENGIREKSYYYWLRKFRKEAAEQMPVPAAVTNPSPVTFAEIPFTCSLDSSTKTVSDAVLPVHPTAILKYRELTIAVTNDISDLLLSRIIREVSHA
jgi:hypothetical protein